MTIERKLRLEETIHALTQAKAGDEQAFALLAAQYKPLIGSLARRYAHCYADLSEARQAALRGLHGAIRRWDGINFTDSKQLHYYLKKEIHRYIRNEAARLTYGQQHYGQAYDKEGKLTDLVDLADDQTVEPDENVIVSERRQILQEALSHLTEQERLVVTGRIYDEKTVRELGAHLGVTHQYISKIYGRALKRLRDWLRPYDIQAT